MRQTLLFLLICVCCWNIQAQGPVHSFIHISLSDGLASNDVYDIAQDSKGFYWVATDNGLQRFDGKRWIKTPKQGAHALPSKPIHQLLVINDSTLMLRLGANVGLFNTSNFVFTPLAINSPDNWNNEPILWQGSGNTVCLIFPGTGILAYHADRFCFDQHGLPLTIPANVHPNALFEDTLKHRYWIAANEGVFVFDRDSKQLYHSGFNPHNLPLLNKEFQKATEIFIDKKRNHWLVYGTDQQRYECVNEASNERVTEASTLKQFYKGRFSIDRVYETEEGEVWLFGRSALFNYMQQQKMFYNNKSDAVRNMGAKFSHVRNIMQDRESGIWVATDEGIYQFYTVLPEVRNVVFQTSSDDNNITDVEELINGEVWLSSRGKGVIVIDSNQRVLRKKLYRNTDTSSFPSLKMGNAIVQHSRTGRVYVGCDMGFVLQINPIDSSLQFFQPTIIANENISDLAEDANGNLFIATASGSIVLYDYRQNLYSKLHLVKGAVNRLMVDSHQRLWISTAESGLIAFDIPRRKVLNAFTTQSGSLLNNYVRSAAFINDSTIAVATDVLEIINLKTGQPKTVTSDDGLLGNTILGMQRDAQGFLWLATSNGICRYNYAKNKFTAYQEKDGFMKFETVGASAIMLANGNIFFGAGNSFVTFPPHNFNVQQSPPPVLITDIKVLNSFLPVDSASAGLELSHDNNSITFFFSSMTYLNKDKLTYYYRLKGLNDNWTVADNQHAAVFTLLPPGNFSFEVRCENDEGFSTPVTRFQFRIHPPFWRTWWFISLIIIVVSIILYLFHRARVNRIVALSELRNRVARDLHDDVGSTLSTISILSTIAKGKLVDNPLQAEQYITKITDNSQQMMDAMDDIVWSIKPMNDSMPKIIARMREFASGVLEPKNIDIEFLVDDKVQHIKLNMESRRDLFLVYKEAINNIAKYAAASRVLVHFSYVRNRLILKIKDDGAGFDVELADNGNGLNNMKKRANMMDGRLKILSQKDKGTVVLLNIPVNA